MKLCVVGSPVIDLIQILELVFGIGYPCELAKHPKELFNEGLLEIDPIGGVILVVVVDDLPEVFELGVVVDKEGVDGEQAELVPHCLLLPLHQPDLLLQLGRRIIH